MVFFGLGWVQLGWAGWINDTPKVIDGLIPFYR